MTARREGSPTTYNRFHSPHEVSHDIATLRALHVEMDHAVAAAYGWTDLDLGHGFHQTKQGIRYTISEAARRKVLDRLLALNHERYAAEQSAAQPLRAPKQKRASARRSRPVYSKESTMSTAPLRQELEDLIRRDLLGPAGGEQEIITEQSVRNRYLLGMLAPLKIVEVDEEPFEELADGSEDNAEEGTAEPSTPAKRSVAPSTFGLSFCLDLARDRLRGRGSLGPVSAGTGRRRQDRLETISAGWQPEHPVAGRQSGRMVAGRRESRRWWFAGGFGSARTTGASRSSSPTNKRKTARATCTGCFRRNWRARAIRQPSRAGPRLHSGSGLAPGGSDQ